MRIPLGHPLSGVERDRVYLECACIAVPGLYGLSGLSPDSLPGVFSRSASIKRGSIDASRAMPVRAQHMRKLTSLLAVLWLVNFGAYLIIATLIGGDAINGHAGLGRYYLAMHGHLTQVSRSVYEYSRWHTYFLWSHTAIVMVMSIANRVLSKRGVVLP
jgi:hypothetical protein